MHDSPHFKILFIGWLTKLAVIVMLVCGRIYVIFKVWK